MRFDDRVAVITGAGRGLGRAYALLLAERGAKVVVNDLGGSLQGEGLDAGPAHDVVQEIKAVGGEAMACTDSVATKEGGEAIIAAALDSYGRIDILIHNAGNVRNSPLAEMSHEDFDAVLDVHLRGAFNVVRPAFARMCDAGYGRLVLTSSIGGLYGNVNVAGYAVSKAGTIGLSNVAAIEGAAFGVKSNCIVPGAVTRMSEGYDTSQFPPMKPELVAPAVGWLCHDSCELSGTKMISIGGRIAFADTVETQGVYQPSWTIEEVATRIAEIRDTGRSVNFAAFPTGFGEHLQYSFKMAFDGGAKPGG